MSARKEVVAQLSKEALDAMDGSGIEDVTPSEVLSASFTACHRVIAVLLANTSGEDLTNNKNSILEGIGLLYELVHPDPMNIH